MDNDISVILFTYIEVATPTFDHVVLPINNVFRNCGLDNKL